MCSAAIIERQLHGVPLMKRTPFIMIFACMALSAREYTQPVPYPYVSYIPEMGHGSAVSMVPILNLCGGL